LWPDAKLPPETVETWVPRAERGTATHSIMDRETKIRIFESAKAEFVRHKWDVFEDEPPSVGAGGSGATVVGCPACRKRINTLDGFFRHQSDDVLPVILQKAFEIAGAE